MTDPDIAVTTLDRDGGERFQRLRRELGVTTFGMNLIVLEPGERGRIHAHRHQEEVYLVLEGDLTVLVEAVEHVVGPDQAIRVGPAVRRQVANLGRRRAVVLALGGHGEHAGRDALAWSAWEETGPGRPPAEVPLPESPRA